MKNKILIVLLATGLAVTDFSAVAQTTTTVKKKGWSRKGKGTAAGAVGGAAIGAVAGGGKGAVIGGAAGAAGGYLFGRRRDRKKGDNRATVIKTKTVTR